MVNMYCYFVTLLLVFFVRFSAQQGHYERGQSFFYAESPLPNTTSILPSKQYEWAIALIGSYNMSFSNTSAYIMQFAADQINNDPNLCPGVKIVLKWADTRYVQSNTIIATLYEIFANNVRAIAGGFTSAETANIQLAAKLYGIPQVSGKATTEDLSDRTNYPNFARTTIGDQLQVKTILELFKQHGWKKAVLIYTNEPYGVSGNGMMSASDVTFYSVEISNTNYSYADVLDQVQNQVEKYRIQVFVFYLLTTPGTAFLKALKDRYSGPNYVFIFTTPLGSSFVETPGSYSTLFPHIDGALLVSADDGRGAVYDDAKAKWNALDPARYPGLRPEPHSFWYWYDTIFLFAHALDAIMQERGINDTTIKTLDDVSYAEYYNSIVSTSFFGTTGWVTIDNHTGDRLGNVGVWNIRNGEAVNIGRYQGNESILIMYEKPTFFGGSKIIPADTAPLPIQLGNESIQIAFGVLISICVVITLVFAFLLFFRTDSFKKSGAFYCGVMIFGSLMAYAAALTTLPTPTDGLCLAFPWLLGMAFMIVFGCLFLKTWALFQVFRAAEKMQKTNLSPKLLLKLMGGLLVIEAIFMIVWSTVGPPTAELVDVTRSGHRQMRCSSGNSVFWAVFIGYKGVWMLFGAVISVLVRNVREDYNESASIGMAVYNCFGATIVAVVLGYLLSDNPNATMIIEIIAILVAFTLTLAIMFFRPISEIFLGAEVTLKWNSATITTAGSSQSVRATTRTSANSANSANSASANSGSNSTSMKSVTISAADDGVFRV